MKTKTLSIAIWLIVGFIGRQSHAQSIEDRLHAAGVAREGSQMTLKHHPEFGGTIIFNIETDRNGAIWMASISGVIKFDGYNYTRHFAQNDDSLIVGSVPVFSIKEDTKGNMWMGGEDQIFKYNPQNKQTSKYLYNHLLDSVSATAEVWDINDNGHGRIYFGMEGNNDLEIINGLVYFDEKEEIIKPFQFPDSVRLVDIATFSSDLNGNVWFLAGNDIFRIDSTNRLHIIPKLPLEENEKISRALGGSDGNIWILSTYKKLYHLDPITNQTETRSLDNFDMERIDFNRPIPMVPDTYGDPLIIADHGIIYLNHETLKFELLDLRQDTNDNFFEVQSIAIDEFGTVWMGSIEKGLSRLINKPKINSWIHDPKNPNSITSGWPYKIFEDNEGIIWTQTGDGTGNDGFNAYNPKTGSLIPYSLNYLNGNQSYLGVITELFPGEMLCHTDSSYVLFNKNTEKITEIDLPGLPVTYIGSVYHDSHNNVWFCTNEGLFKTKNSYDYFDQYSLAQANEDTVNTTGIYSVYETKKGELWIIAQAGIYIYKYETDAIKPLASTPELKNLLPSSAPSGIIEDMKGDFWISFWGSGLYKYNPQTKKLKQFTVRDGLASNIVSKIIYDKKSEKIWIFTYNGINRFDPATEEFYNLDIEDGLHGLLLFVATRSSDGRIYTGGGNGVSRFHPDDFTQLSSPPILNITGFSVGEMYLDIEASLYGENQKTKKDPVILTYDQNNFSIEYSGIHYDNPQKNRFAYHLENYDNEYRQVGNLQNASYFNIPPGRYSFKVKAANSHGRWSESMQFDIQILPPWWRTWWAYVLYVLIFISGVFVVDRVQRKRLVRREKNKAREKELAQAREIEKAYTELKAAQSQLIQSEKMASLGELTAGIAHEIQNPLNFVNNFSEVNDELIEELREAVANNDQQEIHAILNDLKENESKIKHHGQRAEGIVKGMLQHSRTSQGEKEPIDINILADEYLRLAYHGLRAKDKNFNAEFKIDFDASIPKINVIPQDIGRVLLNLINNAFFAVNEKASKAGRGQVPEVLEGQGGPYKPLVTITTKKLSDKIEITIKDNGPGIPDDIKDKIFQPFFTTKPTGQGTGLGLSLSYDIVKTHGGELKFEPANTGGSRFIIHLPKETDQ